MGSENEMNAPSYSTQRISFSIVSIYYIFYANFMTTFIRPCACGCCDWCVEPFIDDITQFNNSFFNAINLLSCSRDRFGQVQSKTYVARWTLDKKRRKYFIVLILASHWMVLGPPENQIHNYRCIYLSSPMGIGPTQTRTHTHTWHENECE